MPRRVDDAAVIGAIAAGLSDDEAALRAGCSPVTIRRRRADPAVQAELREARSETLRRNLDRLGALVSLAITVWRPRCATTRLLRPSRLARSGPRSRPTPTTTSRADLDARLDVLEARERRLEMVR